MKMMLAIVNKSDYKDVIKEMMREGLSVTRFSTTGSFIKGNDMVTLISVMTAESVENALNVLKRTCHSRSYDASRVVTPLKSSVDYNAASQSKEIRVGGANVFILNVEESYKF